MRKSDNDTDHQDIIDEDLYEEIEDEELIEILKEERQKAYQKDKDEGNKPKRPFPKWIFWVIALAMGINVIAVIPQTYSIPAIDFLITSAKLSTDPTIDEYQESVVVIESENSKGTGFSITSDGYIITNHHVIEDKRQLAVAYPEQGLFQAEVEASFPEVDLAVLKVDGEDFPYLELADETAFEKDDPIRFIGNPLRFNGIANEGTVIGYTDLKDWEQPVMMLQAPIYRGNSGSPVIDQNGEVIGVVFATLRHQQYGRVGLAVPIDYFQEKRDQNPNAS
ncbi:S1C family serine protease [Aquibacillus sediminis]|uniref:S1C family serine protease n=1 Tax=Aquibacillus sediminis TaxID=2574734 RepID=UPI00110801DF|nr:serine protease [Aquibacillus sediminis]